jgi:hypothetical protein
MLCREYTILGTAEGIVQGHPLRCKCWKCELCSEDLRRRVIALAIAGEPSTLLTLTTNPHHQSDPTLAAEELKYAFNRLIRRLRKVAGRGTFQYLAVWERTKNEMPHLHVLLRAPFVPQRQISEFMAEQIQAPIIDIRAVRGKTAVARYVGKYLAKDPAGFQGRQHFFYSRQWLATETAQAYEPYPDLGLQWSLHSGRCDKYAALLSSAYEIVPEPHGFTGYSKGPPDWLRDQARTLAILRSRGVI